MWPDRVSNPGPLTHESGSLPTALRGPAEACVISVNYSFCHPSGPAVCMTWGLGEKREAAGWGHSGAYY